MGAESSETPEIETETRDWSSDGTEVEQGEAAPRRKRTGRKRTVFAPPQTPAPAVRDLWNHASDQERTRAHLYCTRILEYWLGKKSKEEIAAELELPPLRIWQLSQQAVSGMLAGLLKQPRRRRGASEPPPPPEEDPRILKKKIAELETKLRRTEDLVRVLRTAPWVEGDPRPASSPRRKKSRGRKQHASRRGATTRSRNSTQDRSSAPGASSHDGRGGGDG